MRRIRYMVAMSLDGFIAGPQGEADWILMDPEIDFGAIVTQFDTILVGRRTLESMARAGNSSMPGMKTIAVSRTLSPQGMHNTTVVRDIATLAPMKTEPGKDIWLFGGGSLFRSLVETRLVDTVEVAIIPILLGGGIAMLPPPGDRVKLSLTGTKVYNKSGIVSLEYSID